MKTKVITLLTLGALALLPIAFVTIGKASTSGKTRGDSSPAARFAEATLNAAPRKSSSTKAKAPSSSSKSKSSSASDKKDETTAEQRRAREKVSDLTTTQKSKMLTLLNDGDAEELAAIKGISTTRAAAIEKARPFDSIDEVVLVRGIGETTFAEVIAHARTLTARRSTSSSSKSKSSKS